MPAELMTPRTRKMPKPESRPVEEQLDEALDRVFQKYGSDLSSFLRDVTEEVSSKQHVKVDLSRSVRW